MAKPAHHDLWARSFVDWSQSDFGFYVNRRYDYTRSRWLYEESPIRWDARQERVLRALFTLRADDSLPVSEYWHIDIGQSGKTTLQAALAQWFAMYIDKDSEVLLNANSQTQAGVRCYGALRDSLAWSPYGREIATVYDSYARFHHFNNVVRPIPKKAQTTSGTPAIFIGVDEIWGYAGAQDEAHMAEQKDTPARNISLKMFSTYPGFLGDEGPLNKTLDTFFDENDQPKAGIEQVEGLEDLPLWIDPVSQVAVWWNHDPYPWHERVVDGVLNTTWLQREAKKPGVTENHYKRIWEARRVQRDDTFMPMDQWDKCEDEAHRPLSTYDRKVPCVAAVDLSIEHDGTAVSVRNWLPALQKYNLVDHKIWTPAMFGGRDKREVVDEVIAYLLDLHQKQNLLAVYYDPFQFSHAALQLERNKLKMIAFTQNNMRILADTAYRNHILSQRLRNYPHSADARQQVEYAVAVNRGDSAIRIDKRKTTHKIDFVVADSMCCYGVTEHKAMFERLARSKPGVQRKPKRANLYKQIYGLGT